MVAVEYLKSLRLPEPDLWLDPRQPQARAFVSHAHSDHTGRHEYTLCTAPTARLMEVRMGGGLGAFEVLPFGGRRDFGEWSATLFPAGHVLGSAQMLYASAQGTLLYTGDFKLHAGLSSEHAQTPRAETLVMETTFGLPRYKFPPAEETAAAVLKFCLEAIEEGETPVLLGYALGKAQEILAVLGGAGLPIMLHAAVWNITKVYEEFGLRFPPHEKYDPARAAGHVIVAPPNVNGSRMLAAIRNRRVAVLTGWALDPSAVHRLQVDAAFPLSDHADYADLWKFVEAVQPRRVLTLHGYAREFARDLRARGLEAWALTGANQLELAIDESPVTVPVAFEAPPVADEGFPRFCAVCESIRQTTGKLEKVRLLAEYLRSLDAGDLPLAATWLTGRAFAQSDDRPLQAGWAVIHRALSLASGLAPAEIRVIARRHNDSGLTATEVMSHRPGGRFFALGGIDRLLQGIRQARGPLAKTDLLAEDLRDLPPLAAGYLVRILTGDLRIGLKEGLVEEAVAAAFEAEPAAVREANMLLGDIGRTAVFAREKRLDAAELSIFRPIKCMLASPEPDSESIWERLGASGSVWIEDKLDGIRAQLHVSPDRVEIYSRDLKRITGTFPEIAAAALRLRRQAVFDGEILAWDKGRALSFFELQKRLGRRDTDLFFVESDIPVAIQVFDLLQLDGRSLLRKPLIERRSQLERLPLAGTLAVAAVQTVRSAGEIEAAFRAARHRSNEGLMAKDPTSLYSPGRRGLAWLKLKKEFATLDVVVVGAEYGHGRRSKVLSDYTFAVRDEDSGALLTIGKAYSGVTDAEIEELTELFLRIAIERRGNFFSVEPRVVLEVAFDSIQPSPRHPSGLSLRFPRIKQIRRDKTPDDIDTLAGARSLLPQST